MEGPTLTLTLTLSLWMTLTLPGTGSGSTLPPPHPSYSLTGSFPHYKQILMPPDQKEKILAMHQASQANAGIYVAVVLAMYVLLLTMLLCRYGGRRDGPLPPVPGVGLPPLPPPSIQSPGGGGASSSRSLPPPGRGNYSGCPSSGPWSVCGCGCGSGRGSGGSRVTEDEEEEEGGGDVPMTTLALIPRSPTTLEGAVLLGVGSGGSICNLTVPGHSGGVPV